MSAEKDSGEAGVKALSLTELADQITEGDAEKRERLLGQLVDMVKEQGIWPDGQPEEWARTWVSGMTDPQADAATCKQHEVALVSLTLRLSHAKKLVLTAAQERILDVVLDELEDEKERLRQGSEARTVQLARVFRIIRQVLPLSPGRNTLMTLLADLVVLAPAVYAEALNI